MKAHHHHQQQQKQQQQPQCDQRFADMPEVESSGTSPRTSDDPENALTVSNHTPSSPRHRATTPDVSSSLSHDGSRNHAQHQSTNSQDQHTNTNFQDRQQNYSDNHQRHAYPSGRNYLQNYHLHPTTPQQHAMYPSTLSVGDSRPSMTEEERELQRRRAEENAAFVKLLEEEKYQLQTPQPPVPSVGPTCSNTIRLSTTASRQSTSPRPTSNATTPRATGEDLGPPTSYSNRQISRGSRGYGDEYRRGLYDPQRNNSQGNQSSSRCHRNGSKDSLHRMGRESLSQAHHQQQPPYDHHRQRNYEPYSDMGSRRRGVDEDRYLYGEDNNRNGREDRQYRPQHYPQHQHQPHPPQSSRDYGPDVPLELEVPRNASNSHNFLADEQNKGSLRHSRDAFHHPDNLHVESDHHERHRNMTVDEMRKNDSSRDRYYQSVRPANNDRANEHLSPSHLNNDSNGITRHGMSLAEAIHNLEMESGLVDGGDGTPVQPMPSSAEKSLPSSRSQTREYDDRRHSSQLHQHRSGGDRQYGHRDRYRPPNDAGLDQYQHLDRGRDHDRRHQQPAPPRQNYSDHHPQRLKGPVESIEFPTNWEGREIEPTLDDEMLDRDEEEYCRRMNAYRHQHHQQSPQMNPSQMPHRSPAPGGGQRNPVQRLQSSNSRTSEAYDGSGGGGGLASDLYSQNLAVSGHRLAPMQIEVSPGVSMPFRGSEETWEAIALNRIAKTECLGCSIQLYCVEDAELVVCPDCQTMSPAYQLGAEGEDNVRRSGLGLGFKEEQLVQWKHA